MDPMHELAEARIREAAERGEFDDLAGAGRPLELDDDRMVPPELRMAYRILKNANCLPPELDTRREIREIEDLLRHVDDTTGEQQRRAQRRLLALRLRLEAGGRSASCLSADPRYQEELARRMAPRDEAEEGS